VHPHCRTAGDASGLPMHKPTAVRPNLSRGTFATCMTDGVLMTREDSLRWRDERRRPAFDWASNGPASAATWRHQQVRVSPSPRLLLLLKCC